MKICYYGNFSESWTTESYVARALERAGCEVSCIQECAVPFQLHTRMEREQTCDIFLFAKGRFGTRWSWEELCEQIPLIRQHTKKVVCWVWDLLNPDFSAARYEWASNVSEQVDLFLTTDGSIVQYLSNAKVLRQGIPDDVRQARYNRNLECDILFLGEAYGNRREWVEDLQRYFNRRFWHISSGYRGDILNDLFGSCKVVLGPNWPSYPKYWSNRLAVTTGYGGCFVGPAIRGMEDEGWIPGRHYIDSSCMKSFKLSLGVLLDDPNRYNLIAEQGHVFARETQTYDRRVKELLTWIS